MGLTQVGKGVCAVPVPGGCCYITQHGRGRMDRTTVLYTLHWPLSTQVVCVSTVLATAARLLAACK